MNKVRTYLCATAVDSGYAGPRLDGEITAGFMSELLDWMRNQKILHRKYAFKVQCVIVCMAGESNVMVVGQISLVIILIVIILSCN